MGLLDTNCSCLICGQRMDVNINVQHILFGKKNIKTKTQKNRIKNNTDCKHIIICWVNLNEIL